MSAKDDDDFNNNCNNTYIVYLTLWEKVFYIFYKISDKSSLRCIDVLVKIEDLIVYIKNNINIFTSPLIAIILDVIIQVLHTYIYYIYINIIIM